MKFTNIKDEPVFKKKTPKFAMIAGTAIIASTLFAGTALASGDSLNNSSDNQPAKHQFMLTLKNGTDDPINLTGSSAEMIKTQVESLVKSGKITAQAADKILTFGNQVKGSSDSSEDKRFMINDPNSKQLKGKQLKLCIKNGSGDPIEISGSSPEMIRSQVQSLLEAGKITQQTADKLINSLGIASSNEY